MRIEQLAPQDLLPALDRFWAISANKISSLNQTYDATLGSPVFTVKGNYATRGWTEWTQGFQFGSEILQFDATGDEAFLEMGKTNTVEKMAAHVTHFGVHDHGFNNVSTYGNLLRLMNEGRITEYLWERNFYELALKISGAVQAQRWTDLAGGGYVYSFNGPHSLFADTIRSLRSLAVGHRLGSDYLNRPADPFNDWEPVDSSAAAIGAQGLIRFGGYLHGIDNAQSERYTQAGLTVLKTLLDEPYLSTDDDHQGLLLHSVYHRPNDWDHIPSGHQVPCGESSMWGDYHAREVALLVTRLANDQPYLKFYI